MDGFMIIAAVCVAAWVAVALVGLVAGFVSGWKSGVDDLRAWPTKESE